MFHRTKQSSMITRHLQFKRTETTFLGMALLLFKFKNSKMRTPPCCPATDNGLASENCLTIQYFCAIGISWALTQDHPVINSIAHLKPRILTYKCRNNKKLPYLKSALTLYHLPYDMTLTPNTKIHPCFHDFDVALSKEANNTTI